MQEHISSSKVKFFLVFKSCIFGFVLDIAMKSNSVTLQALLPLPPAKIGPFSFCYNTVCGAGTKKTGREKLTRVSVWLVFLYGIFILQTVLWNCTLRDQSCSPLVKISFVNNFEMYSRIFSYVFCNLSRKLFSVQFTENCTQICRRNIHLKDVGEINYVKTELLWLTVHITLIVCTIFFTLTSDYHNNALFLSIAFL